MKKRVRVGAVLMAAIMIVSLFAACAGQTNASTDDQSFEADKIAVTYVKSPLNVPSIVEKDQKFFEQAFAEYNLPVEYSDLTTGPEQTQALASGDLQFLNAVGATSVILAAANGNDIKIISMYSRSPEAFVLFGKDDSIQSAADLKGKKVGGPKGTILHELLVAYLKTAGLTEQDVEFVSLDLPKAQAALESGSIDVAMLAGANAYQAKKAGFPVITTGKDLVDGTIVVATSQAFYDKNKVLVDTFLDTQAEILAYMDENYEEAMQAAAEETEMDLDAVKEMYELYDFSMEIKDSDIASMKSTEEFLFENGMTENRVDVESLILER